MRILLIQSYLGRKEKAIYPLGLATLASMLDEHEVKIVDPNILENPIGDLKVVVRDFKPDFAGISLRNVDTTQVRDPYVYTNGMNDCIEAVKEVSPDTKIIVGGAGFSIYAEEIMRQYPHIDCGVYLEAEETLPDLLENWGDFANVRGIYYRENGEILSTGIRRFPDINKIPAPDWVNVPIAPYKDMLDAVGIQTKRGCSLRCAYCSYPFLNGKHYRFRTPEQVVDEIEILVNNYGLERFIFVDSVFNIPRNHAENVMREIIKRKLKVKWTGWYNERELDKDLVELAIEAGCELFSFSPDGFSDKSLKALGKNLRKKDILRVFKLMKQYPQVMVGYNFFLNPPEQTFIDLIKLLMFAVKAKLAFRGRIVGFLLGSIRIEPDTAIYDRAVGEGFISRETPMLVNTSDELLRLFYKPPKSVVLDWMLKSYIGIRKLKHAVRPPREI